MKTFKVLVSVIVFVSIVYVFSLGLYNSQAYIWDVYLGLEYNVRVVLLTGVATASILIFVLSGAIKSAGMSIQKSKMMSGKISLYSRLIKSYSQLILDYQSGAISESHNEIKNLRNMYMDLLLLSSKAVLGACDKLDIALKEDNKNTEIISEYFDSLIKYMRKDLGHRQIYNDISQSFIENISDDNTDHEAKSKNSPPIYN